MPNAIVGLCAVVLVGFGVTSTALGAGFRDGGTSSVYTCQAPGMGTVTGWDPTNWSQAPIEYGARSELSSQDAIPNCKTTEVISYISDSRVGASKRNSCAKCNTGYRLVSYTAPSIRQPDCIVTWEECEKDELPDDPLELCPDECKMLGGWMDVPKQTGLQTQCDPLEQKCLYRCGPGYYNAALSIGTMCQPCPDNVLSTSCAGGADYNSVCCERGYYRQTITRNTSTGLIIRYKDVTCPRCPSLGGVYGTTPMNQCVSSITACYIPANTPIKSTPGTYVFTNDCDYSTTAAGTGTVTPVQPDVANP